MKRLIHSCVQREAVKRSVSPPHHVVAHALHEQSTIWSLMGKKKNRFSLESLFSFTIKSLIIIIIIVEKWVFSTYKREKSHHSLI